ncbi:unnamed protein product [Cyclocybe aegerita]|uniref:Nephrocystin 3-like N-terminal domain-containing protein n=1 Tax=Cyclocybe aegerita TaxID=1973307 RepID=A0A8S0VVS7_CYCAE|nr:unnamed protein product [Cyclocybe aegerita]
MTSPNATPPPVMRSSTRLKKIMSWVKSDTDAFVFWLNGTVGPGKSAIAQTTADLCEAEGFLFATFFFGCPDPTRNNAKFLITTLAYQIARAIPAARQSIEHVFECDPLIYTQSMETQALKLMIEPLQ